MPGESEQQYHASLTELLQELQATTVLKYDVAEKVHECLWWKRRYQVQKRTAIAAELATITNGSRKLDAPPTEKHIRKPLFTNRSLETLDLALAEILDIHELLQQKAMANRAQVLQSLEQHLALQAKILIGLQASYEVAFIRKAHAKRLQLQNSLLQSDLQSIDLKSLNSDPPASVPNGRP